MKNSLAPLNQARAMYLLQYMAMGSFIPFINLYYSRLGLSGIEIGALTSVSTLISSSAAFFWSALADSRRIHRPLLSASLLLSPLAIFLLSLAPGFSILVPCVAIYALINSPALAIVEGNALEVVNTENRSYGEMRLWGTIGWGIATLGMGAMIEQADIRWLFYGAMAMMLLTFLLSLAQPPRRLKLRAPLAHGLSRLLQPELLILFLGSFLVTIASGAVEAFLSIYLDGIGANETLIGMAWAIVVLGEVPMMLYSGPVLKRIGSSGLLKAGLGLYIATWVLYYLIRDPVWVLGLQVLNGLAFGAFLSGAVTYLNERTPQGLGTTSLAIFNSICFGVSVIVGSLLAGMLRDLFDMSALFIAATGLVLAGLLLFTFSPHSSRAPVQTSSDE